MTEVMSGHVIGGPVNPEYDGSVLTVAVAVNDTVLHIEDTADFDELADKHDGHILLGVDLGGDGKPDPSTGTRIAYTTCTDGTDATITLAVPSPVAAEIGDMVYIAGPGTGLPVGQAEVMVAMDDGDTSGDALTAIVDVTLLDSVGDVDLTDQSVDLVEDPDDGQLHVTGFPGLTQTTGDVKAEQDSVIATGPGELTLLLKYLPIKNSEHLYWNGQYRSGFKWSRSGYVVTIHDPAGVIAAGDAFWMEYLYTDATPRPAQTITFDIPALIISTGIHETIVGDEFALTTDDGDTSYMRTQVAAHPSSSAGSNVDIAFPPASVPGTLESTSLVTIGKGTDSREALPDPGFGWTFLLTGPSPTFTSWFWTGIFANEATDWTETETPLLFDSGSGLEEVVTKTALEAGAVEYNPGYALLSCSSAASTVGWDSYFTYIALRVTCTVPAYDGIPDDFSTDDGSHDPLIRLAQVEAGGGGGGSGSYYEVLMADGVTGPPEPLETQDRDDWLYGEVTP